MCEPECPDEFVTKAELFAAFEQAGVSISEDQLARWRGWALLPPVRQIGLGRPGGSKAFYPKITIDQAIEAKRLFGKRRAKEFVGFELWWLGFDVDQQYWRPVIDARSRTIARVVRKISKTLSAARNDDAIADAVYRKIPKSMAPQPIKGITRNIRDEDFVDVFHMLLNAIAGTENSLESSHILEEEDHRPRTLSNLLGFSQAETDQILGIKIDVGSAFPSVLKVISSIQYVQETDDAFFDGEKFQRFNNAKNEVRDILESMRNANEALAWIYGSRAFGLKVARWFPDRAKPTVKGLLALMWMCAREAHPDEFSSNDTIRSMHKDSRTLLCKSHHFKTIIDRNTQLRAVCTPKRLKKAFSSKSEYNRLLSELGKFSA